MNSHVKQASACDVNLSLVVINRKTGLFNDFSHTQNEK